MMKKVLVTVAVVEFYLHSRRLLQFARPIG